MRFLKCTAGGINGRFVDGSRRKALLLRRVTSVQLPGEVQGCGSSCCVEDISDSCGWVSLRWLYQEGNGQVLMVCARNGTRRAEASTLVVEASIRRFEVPAFLVRTRKESRQSGILNAAVSSEIRQERPKVHNQDSLA